MRVRSLLPVPLALLVACSGAPVDSGNPPPADDTAPSAPEVCGYTPAPDLDPAADTVEIELRASSLAWDPGTGVPLDEVAEVLRDVDRGGIFRPSVCIFTAFTKILLAGSAGGDHRHESRLVRTVDVLERSGDSFGKRRNAGTSPPAVGKCNE